MKRAIKTLQSVGINAVRVLLPKCWFDAKRCERGVDALKLYHADTDRHNADPGGQLVLKPTPVHDWTSHAADSLRYFAMTEGRLNLAERRPGRLRELLFATHPSTEQRIARLRGMADEMGQEPERGPWS